MSWSTATNELTRLSTVHKSLDFVDSEITITGKRSIAESSKFVSTKISIVFIDTFHVITQNTQILEGMKVHESNICLYEEVQKY